MDVDKVTLNAAKPVGLVKNHLLCVRQQLCMECEVVNASQVSWEPCQNVNYRQEEEVGCAANQAEQRTERKVVKESVFDQPFALVRLVQEDSVFMGFDSCEASVLLSTVR